LLFFLLLAVEVVSCADTSSGEARVGLPESETDPLIYVAIAFAVTAIACTIIFMPDSGKT